MTGRAAPRAIATSIAACLILATQAMGSTIDIEPNPITPGQAVVYRAVPGEVNQFFVLGQSADLVVVQDGFGAVAITPTPPCAADASFPADPRFAQCPAAGVTGIAAFLGDGADLGGGAMGGTTPTLLDGEEDNDSLTGAWGDDLVLGGPGDDILLGEPGNDILDGGPGADDLRGENGLAGDTGFDMADYSDRVLPVTATLDGVRNDGEPGEGDLLEIDMDDVNGGFAGDTITGDAKENFLLGNDGNDTLDGGGGSDILDGGNGDDTIVARDGLPDQINCGAGTDTVTADAVDSTVDCESVALPVVVVAPVPAAAPAPVLHPRDLTAPTLTLRRIAAPRLRTALRRGLTLRAACSEACTLRGVALFRGRVVARGTGSGAAGVTRAVTLRFTRSATRTLRRLRTARLTLRLTATDPSANRRTVTRSLTLRR